MLEIKNYYMFVFIDSTGFEYLSTSLHFFPCLLFAVSYQNAQGNPGENDPNNTTVGRLFFFGCGYY